ncbi:5872_t:CDS:2, partial [Scutellospora calospora]
KGEKCNNITDFFDQKLLNVSIFNTVIKDCIKELIFKNLDQEVLNNIDIPLIILPDSREYLKDLIEGILEIYIEIAKEYWNNEVQKPSGNQARI